MQRWGLSPDSWQHSNLPASKEVPNTQSETGYIFPCGFDSWPGEFHPTFVASLTDNFEVTSIAQSIVTFAQVEYGLGYQVDLLTQSDERMFAKVWLDFKPHVFITEIAI
jgi:hypothetical protein